MGPRTEPNGDPRPPRPHLRTHLREGGNLAMNRGPALMS